MWLSNRKQFTPNLGQTLNLGCLCSSGRGVVAETIILVYYSGLFHRKPTFIVL
jgi:hypothetical protein